VPDLQEDPRRLTIDQNLNVRALLVAPVKSHTQCTGTLSVQSAIPNTFTADDEQLLTVLGIQAGMAIENARLFSTQQRARRIAERQRERVRHMAHRIVIAQEEERQRISRELHDDVGQALTSLKIGLSLMRKDLSAVDEPVQQTLAELIDLTNKTMSSLRLLVHNLRPPGLETYGLAASLEGLCQDFVAHTHLQVEYSGIELPKLPQLTELSLYRFVQEALTNVLKHADATWVDVIVNADAENIWLFISDNGNGFDLPQTLAAADLTGGLGIGGMIERLEMIGGYLDIQTAPTQGTRLVARVPLLE
jgi:signal transduction histidine kinase